MRSFISTHQRTSKKRRRIQGLAVCPPTGHDSNKEDSSTGRRIGRHCWTGRGGGQQPTPIIQPAWPQELKKQEAETEKAMTGSLRGLSVHFSKHGLPPPRTNLLVSDLLPAWVLGQNPAPGKIGGRRDEQARNGMELEMESQSLPV